MYFMSFLTKMISNPEDIKELIIEANNCGVNESNIKDVYNAILSELSDDELFELVSHIVDVDNI